MYMLLYLIPEVSWWALIVALLGDDPRPNIPKVDWGDAGFKDEPLAPSRTAS
jgi:hypothetical protein